MVLWNGSWARTLRSPRTSVPGCPQSLSENAKVAIGRDFWWVPRRGGKRIPAVGCDCRANDGRHQRARRGALPHFQTGSRKLNGNMPRAGYLHCIISLRFLSRLLLSSFADPFALADGPRPTHPSTSVHERSASVHEHSTFWGREPLTDRIIARFFACTRRKFRAFGDKTVSLRFPG